VFDLLTGCFFLVAFILVVARAIRGCWPSGLLLLWLVLGSLASILSFGAPNMLRMLLVTPAVACVLAMGLDALWQSATARTGKRWSTAIFVCLLLWYAAGETRRYFIDWGTSPLVPASFNSNMVELSAWIREQPDRPDTVVMPQYLYDTPTVRFEMDRMEGKISDSEWVPGGEAALLIAPLPPYPPLEVSEEVERNARLLRRFQMAEGAEWAVVLELDASP